VTSGGGSAASVAELAAAYGVQASFGGGDGLAHRAGVDVLLAIVQALGAPIGSAAGAADALAERREVLARRPLEPVLVHRTGRLATTTITLPSRVHPRQVWCTIAFEDGRISHQRLSTAIIGMTAGAAGANRYHIRIESDGAEPFPPGYHRFTLEGAGHDARALLVAAPPCPRASRAWGIFLPLHAVRTDADWGVGAYPDLADLGGWAESFGGSLLGGLPLYPAFLDPPADPSPYLPVSRLAYNELFVDPTSLPEMALSPEARQLVASDAFRRRLSEVHRSTLVDYEEVYRLRREVLTLMADALLSGDSARRRACSAFFDEHPELMAYARFRAAQDRLGRRAAGGVRPPGSSPVEEPTLGYHLYSQWAAFEQLAAAAVATPLYADLPVGSHPDGFDPHWAPRAFVPGVHGGAPPDLFFEGGQDWAFPPLHPEHIRDEGYQFVIDMLRRAFRHAAVVRVDHVMGLQRLYFIPEGFDATHGAYVSYRAEELHALVSLEAHRAGAVVVGEDLGTVPDEVRRRMAEDRMLRSWVLQFESTAEEPLPEPPAPVMASWATHDLPRFGAYFWGEDIDEKESGGHLNEAEAEAQRTERTRWRQAMLSSLGQVDGGADVAATALRGCLAHLARSNADLMLVDLEELWGERQPQNRPGTGTEAGNWRLRATRTLEEVHGDAATATFLSELQRLRGAPDDVTTGVGVQA
jgi:4-alpha-glucanotransferase